jgi:hypothetical protein
MHGVSRPPFRKVVLAVGITVAGCATKKPDPGPACPEVVDHMLAVMKQGLTGHDAVDLGNRKQMIEQCEARDMSAAERKCLAAAKDLTALATCAAARRDPSAAPPTAPSPAAVPPPPTPAAPSPEPAREP